MTGLKQYVTQYTSLALWLVLSAASLLSCENNVYDCECDHEGDTEMTFSNKDNPRLSGIWTGLNRPY
jgi:hypothetical protein